MKLVKNRDKDMTMNYILITPIKNEEKYLDDLVTSVSEQTILPITWVIIDGNSNDSSMKIIKKYAAKYEFIYLKSQESFSDIGGHINFSLSVREGHDYAKHICEKNKLEYDYIGKIDADIILPNNHFEKLMEIFEKNPEFGIISGKSEACYTSKKSKLDYLPDEVPDSSRMYKKECLEQIGGFVISKYSPDTVMLAKSRTRGWKTLWVRDTYFYSMRETSGIERNVWKAAKQVGNCRYYLNYNPILVILGILFELRKRPHYQAIGYLLGYLDGFAKKERINDSEILDYYMNKRIKEIFVNFLRSYL